MVRLLSLVMLLVIGNTNLTQAQYRSYTKGVDRETVLKKINKLRKKGCRCGGERMKPVGEVNWNSTLEKSAFLHAKEMQQYNYFSHHSIDNLDVGQRLDVIGYKWHYAGENLAVGQKTFDETMRDWIKSDTHCRMLMNPNMKEVGVSRFGKYWVQHFGTMMPPKTRRTKVTYTEG